MGSARVAVVVSIVVSIPVSIPACSLGAFSGYSSGGVEPNDGSAGEAAAAEASAGDGGGLSPDGGGDATADGGDGGDAGCQGVFCDDFERVVVDQGWDLLVQKSGGTMAIVDGTAKAVTPNDATALAFIEKKLMVTVSHATLAFWLNMPSPARVQQVARIRLDASNGSAVNFYLQTKTNGSINAGEQLYDGANYVNAITRDVTIAFKANTWQYWKLELDASVAPAKGRVFVDGALIREDVLTNPVLPGTARVDLGTTFCEAGPELAVRYDGVTVAFPP